MCVAASDRACLTGVIGAPLQIRLDELTIGGGGNWKSMFDLHEGQMVIPTTFSSAIVLSQTISNTTNMTRLELTFLFSRFPGYLRQTPETKLRYVVRALLNVRLVYNLTGLVWLDRDVPCDLISISPVCFAPSKSHQLGHKNEPSQDCCRSSACYKL